MGLWKRHSEDDLGPQPLLGVSTNPAGAEERRAGLVRGSLHHLPTHSRTNSHNNTPKAAHTNGLHHSPHAGHSSLPYTPSLSSLHQPGHSYTSHRRSPSRTSLSYTPSHTSLPYNPSKIPLSSELRLYRPNTVNNNNTNYCSLPYSPGLLAVSCPV